MAKKPDDRYPTGRAMAMAARAVLAPAGASSTAGDLAGVTTRLGAHRTEPSGPILVMPGVSGAWPLSALGGPWHFARGRTGSTGGTGAPVDADGRTVQIRRPAP
jgi:hypothetical protein